MNNKLEVIMSLNGRQYSVKAPIGRDIEPGDIEQAKQDILSGKILAMNPATCRNVVQGTTQQITFTATGGQPNYTYKLLLDGNLIASAGPMASTSHTFSVSFNQAIGTHTLKGEIIDSCATPQTASDQCTFDITASGGSISCTTTPAGASVALDGVSQGVVTPVTLTNVSAGSHSVTFTLSGYNSCQASVTVTAGSTATASCTLTAIVTKGSISCITTPAGASVALDGVSQGVVTPVTLTNVSAGSHSVTFTLSGYNSCQASVTVTAGSTATASCTLTAIVTKGSISCITTPSGASVALDGVSLGVVTPVTLTNVSAGSHSVTFTLSGYNSCQASVTVTAGSTATASCTLTAITNICTWITNNGGVTGMTIPRVFDLVDAYIGVTNIGFIPTNQQIFGCVDYYLGFTTSGNSKTGCSF